MSSIRQESTSDDVEHLFKIVLIGDSEVGKSNILKRFTKNTFSTDSKTTIGVEFSAKKMVVDGSTVKIQLWDTAGQEKFRAITKAYYRGAVGAMLVYDITNKKTFESIAQWNNQIREWADSPNILVMMLGNKADMEENRQVSKEESIQFAENNKMGFLETSAKTGQNVEFAFKKLVEEVLRNTIKNKTQSEIYGTESMISEKGKTFRESKNVVLTEQTTKKNKKKQDDCC